MSYHYVVTAHKPTNVTHAAVGNFTSPTDLNLVICKCTRLELHTMVDDGLQPVYDLPIYGRVATLQLWRPPGERTDLIFLSTERYQFAVLGYDAQAGEIVTRANGDLKDRIGRPAEFGQIAIIEPRSRLIGLRLYEGLLKLIPVSPAGGVIGSSGGGGGGGVGGGGGASALREAFNVRLEELHVIDLVFLHGMPKPTVAVLYQDPKEARNVKTYEVMVKDRAIADGPWSQNHVEGGASMLQAVPEPYGGVLIIGEQTITYHNGHTFCSIVMRPTLIRACGRVDDDGRRWLLGDDRGALLLLALHAVPPEAAGVGLSSGGRAGRAGAPVVTSLGMQVLGVTSAPSVLCYLDNGIVFVGSSYGDSQLVRLGSPGGGEPAASAIVMDTGVGVADATGQAGSASALAVLDVMPNLGPILDFCVVDLERQGQGQVVCCSGAFKDGSLRIMRNGIGIEEHASVELPGIKGLWALREASAAAHDALLVVSFMHETVVLALDGDSLEETTVSGFDAGAKSLLCANLDADLVVQVCGRRVGLVAAQPMRPAGEWLPPVGREISVAAAAGTDVVVALSGPPELIYLRATAERGLEQVATARLEQEASCMTLSHPTSGRGGKATGTVAGGAVGGRLVAVGLWTRMDVLLLRLPSLEEVLAHPLQADVMPRSLLFASFDSSLAGGSGSSDHHAPTASDGGAHGSEYLICGMGDGRVIYYRLVADGGPGAAPALSERKQVPLGTQPVELTPFVCKGARHVFCASDRPAVISASKYKLLFANVNLRGAAHMTPFDSAGFPESLAIASKSSLCVGSIDNIQKLHIKTVPLHEHPRRIAHDEASRTFAVCTVQQHTGVAAGPGAAHAVEDGAETYHVRLMDDSTFEIVDTHTLRPSESACSILACEVRPTDGRGGPVCCYVVGTAFILPDEPEPTAGRLLLLGAADGSLQLLAEVATKGAVYSLAELRGRVVAGVNNRVEVYAWDEGGAAAAALPGSLRLESRHHGHILALFVETRGDFIVVGDLMKSVSLHVFKPDTSEIEDIARDYNSNWITALEVVDDDTFVAAEAGFNLFTVRKNAEATTDEERQRLETASEFHLGEHVNRFRKGSLTMQLADADVAPMPTLLFGTVNGVIGVIAQLPPEVFTFLAKLQSCLAKVVPGIGGLKHRTWRSFHNERKTADATNFIDGDLVELFLDLPRAKQDEVCQQVGLGHEELCKRVEELTRLH